MPARRAAAAGLAGALLLAACTIQTERPERAGKLPDIQGVEAARRPAPVDATVRGRVVGPTGSAIADAAVGVSVDVDDGGALLAGLLFPLTAPLVILGCALGGCGDPQYPATGTSDDYAVLLPDAHYPGYEGNDDWTVHAGSADGRSFASQSFEVAAATYDLPDLVLLSPTVDEEVRGDGLTIRIPPLVVPDADGGAVPGTLTIRTADGYAIASEALQERFTLDRRLLEDFTTEVVVDATWDVTEGPTVFHHAAQVATPLRTTAGAPASRGATCTITTTDGGVSTPGTCPLTDGQLATRLGDYRSCPPSVGQQALVVEPIRFDPATGDTVPQPPPADPLEACVEIEDVVIDLGAPVAATLLVPRCWCVVERSLDGVTWTDVAGVREARAPAPAPLDGAEVRFVRILPVTFADAAQLAGTAEVSVWTTAAAAEPEAVDQPVSGGAQGPSLPPVDRRPMTAVAVVSLLVSAALAVAVRRELQRS